VEIELPAKEAWVPTYFILATAEASSNLARYDGVRYGVRVQGDENAEIDMITATRSAGFGAEVKRRIMLGTYVLSAGYQDAYYHKAQQARRLIADAYTTVFEQVDFVVMPTTPTSAFARGEITDPVTMWLSDLFTVSANIAGIPAISIPCGVDQGGLPIGVQVQGPMFADQQLLDWLCKAPYQP
jgi:aspartyl-tRNA(Asn)/glutamyl-tRNA(Gln) amidotransferase subunit A